MSQSPYDASRPFKASKENALAAAREEGRREGEAMIADLRRSADASHLAASNNAQRASEAEAALRAERAASAANHAAQLVALREEAAKRICPHCRDGKRLIPPPPGWNFFYAHEDPAAGGCQQVGCAADGWWRHPLPDAEAALEKVREGAVRDFLAKEPSGRWGAAWYQSPSYDSRQRPYVYEQDADGRCMRWSFGSMEIARAVANALNALGAKGRE